MNSLCSIILAAGRSVRLRPLTDDKPKCLVQMGPKTILDWQLQALESVGCTDTRIVVGYLKEMIIEHIQKNYPNFTVTYIENPDFAITNTLFSLERALREYSGDYYYLNADVVFDERIMKQLAKYTDGGFLAVDRKQCREEEVKVIVNEKQITEIGKHLDPEICYGEFIGIAKFSGEFATRFRETVMREAHAGNEMKFFEHALDTMLDKRDMTAIDITGLPCVEIDFPEDYDYAVREVLATFQKGLAQ